MHECILFFIYVLKDSTIMRNTAIITSAVLLFTFAVEVKAQTLQETFVSANRQIHVEELASTEMQYLFPDMVEGTVYQNGKGSERMLNYHVLFEMFYTTDRRGTRIYIRPDGIDSIRTGDMIFSFYDGAGYFQLIQADDNATLLKKYSIDIQSETLTVGAYGSTSRSASAQSVQSLIEPSSGSLVDRTVLLENPAGQELHVTLRRQEVFYLLKDGAPVRVNSRRALLREFPEHRSDLRGFVREHNIDFESESDMIKLASFVYSLF